MSGAVRRPQAEEIGSGPARGLIELWLDAIERWIVRFDRGMGGVTGRREGRDREEGRGPTLR